MSFYDSCPICNQQRKMNPHHLIPKSLGGINGKKLWMCKRCHRFIHAHISNWALFKHYRVPEKLIKYARQLMNGVKK